MKSLLIILTLLFSIAAQAITGDKVEDLLRSRGLSVEQVRAQGMEVYMGENTGHIPFAKMRVLITDHEAILKSEIDSVEGGATLGSLKTVRYNGRYILKKDIKAAVSVR